ncbi:helix-turn-helix domain-containing protein [Actinomycetospora sp. OC33-EN08]|uniref:Helix-turn-helix domain-containing protein n=1 Tax=Actinomycetospora aurantiaca TaxID=3129233 RepID=A0ABU8MQD4_9PSEU
MVTPSRSRLACATHELIGVIGDRWSVLVLIELGDHGPTRSADLERAVDGVSQKVLTACLRRLEGRGFVARTVEATVPVSVTYELTDFGHSFFAAFTVLRTWADDHVEQLDPDNAPPAR